MYYKVMAGTPLYKKLMKLCDKIEACKKASRELGSELSKPYGGAVQYLQDGFVLAGGLTGIQLTQKPKGWKKATKRYADYYIPSDIAANAEIKAKISALPKVEYDELNSLVNYASVWGHPGIKFGEEYVLLRFAPDFEEGNPYKPAKGMIEITGTEFRELDTKRQKSKAAATK